MLDSTPGTHSSSTCTTYKQEQKKPNKYEHPSIFYQYPHPPEFKVTDVCWTLEPLPAGQMEQAEWHPGQVHHRATLRQTTICTHTQTHLKTIYMLVLNCRKKLEILGRPHADSGRTCKLHIEISQNLTHNLLSVRRQH